jgi:hypothetical protein
VSVCRELFVICSFKFPNKCQLQHPLFVRALNVLNTRDKVNKREHGSECKSYYHRYDYIQLYWKVSLVRPPYVQLVLLYRFKIQSVLQDVLTDIITFRFQSMV